MDQRITDIRNSNWASIINACQESGLSIRKWCTQNHVSEGSYYYHLHKLRLLALENDSSQEKAPLEVLEEAPPAVDNSSEFVPVAMNATAEDHSGVSLRVTRGDLVIEVSNDASEGILSLVREVLLHAS